MATSGTFTGNFNNSHFHLKTVWWVNSTRVTNYVAYSNITIQSILYSDPNYRIVASTARTSNIYVDGGLYSQVQANPSVAVGGQTVLHSITLDIAHDGAGNRAVAISSSFGPVPITVAGTTVGSASAGGTAYLDNIYIPPQTTNTVAGTWSATSTNGSFVSTTINWSGFQDGVNNDINAYEIWCQERTPSGGWSGRINIGYVSTRAHSGSYTWSGGTPGNYYRFNITALGDAPGYYSDTSLFYPGGGIIKNTPPTISGVQSIKDLNKGTYSDEDFAFIQRMWQNYDTIPSKADGEFFNFVVSANDTQNNPLTYQSDQTANWITNPGARPDFFTLKITPTNTRVSFRVFDQLQFSNVVEKVFRVNTIPQIINFTLNRKNTTWSPNISQTNILNWETDKTDYICTINRYSCASLTADNNFDWANSTKELASKAIISGSKIGSYEDKITTLPGNYVSYEIIIFDGYDTATQRTPNFFKNIIPLQLGSVNLTAYNKDNQSNVVGSAANQFNNSIFLTWSNDFITPELSAPLKNIKIEYSQNSVTNFIDWVALPLLPKTATNYTFDATAVGRGAYLKIRISFIDEADLVTSTVFSKYEGSSADTNTWMFKKAELPSVGGNIEFNVSNVLKPLSMTNDLNVKFLKPVSDNMNTFKNNINSYQFYFNVNSEDYIVSASGISEENESLGISITKQAILNGLGLLNNLNTAYENCTFKIKVIDVFGNSNTVYNNSFVFSNAPDIIINSFSIDLKEPPIWGAGQIVINLKAPDSTQLLGLNGWVNVGEYSLVNPKEIISFTLPSVDDNNLHYGENSDKLIYRLRYIMNAGKDSFLSEDIDSSKWTDTPYIDSQSPQISYTLPSVGENTIIAFAVEVLDKTGLSSGIKVCNKKVELCRKVDNANINFNSVDFYKSGEDLGLTIKSSIFDLGGSIINPQRNKTYKDRRNFERGYSGYVPQFKVNVIYSTNKDFTDSVKVELLNLTNSYPFTLPNDGNLDTISIDKIIPSLAEDISYFIKLEIIYKRDSYETTPFTYVTNTLYLLGAAPLVAYRKEQVGINTKIIQPDAVLQVQQTEEKKKIILNGFSYDANQELVSKQIVLDLSTGELYGSLVLNISDNDNW